jgi:hypothetical protein
MAIVISLAAIAWTTGVVGLCILVPALLERSALQPVALLVLLAVAFAVHVATLGLTGDLLEARKERLLEALRSPD